MKKVPKHRLHHPEGGGYKPTSQPHKLKKYKKAMTAEERILRKRKITLKDLKELVDENS
jgi:hypothetical protein